MKIQLEGIEDLEGIFREILNSGENSKNTQEELDVLMHIKNLFLKNTEIAGEEMSIGEVTQERVERKKEHAKLISQVEEAEKNKIDTLKALCDIRKTLPISLKEEVAKEYKEIVRQLQEDVPVMNQPQKTTDLDEEITRIKETVKDLSERCPIVVSQIKEKISYVEREVKERAQKNSREIETESLSILFKDDLELPDI